MSTPGDAPSERSPLLFARLIKIEHSVYALPFAFAGAFLAELRFPGWWDLLWITVAMVGARSSAMALNRLIDAGIDARNPRTAARELPAGKLRRKDVWFFTAVSVALLVIAAFQLSPPCRYLWPIPLAAFVAYPYSKRLTALCHYALGLTLGLAPAAAWIAVTGSVSLEAVLLFLAVGLWVGGFDVIYGIFDLDFDRREGLHSVAVALGWRRALLVALLSHVAAVAPARRGRGSARSRARLLDRPPRRRRAARLVARRHRSPRARRGRHGLHERQRCRGPAVRRRRHRRGAPALGTAAGVRRRVSSRSSLDTRDGTIAASAAPCGDRGRRPTASPPGAEGKTDDVSAEDSSEHPHGLARPADAPRGSRPSSSSSSSSSSASSSGSPSPPPPPRRTAAPARRPSRPPRRGPAPSIPTSTASSATSLPAILEPGQVAHAGVAQHLGRLPQRAADGSARRAPRRRELHPVPRREHDRRRARHRPPAARAPRRDQRAGLRRLPRQGLARRARRRPARSR